MLEVYRLSIRQLTGPVRLGLIILLSALPVALALLVGWTTGEDGIERDGFVNVVLNGLLVAGVLPIATMTLGTAAFGNEMEDGTLAHLALMPLPRWQIVLAKLLAASTRVRPRHHRQRSGDNYRRTRFRSPGRALTGRRPAVGGGGPTRPYSLGRAWCPAGRWRWPCCMSSSGRASSAR